MKNSTILLCPVCSRSRFSVRDLQLHIVRFKRSANSRYIFHREMTEDDDITEDDNGWNGKGKKKGRGRGKGQLKRGQGQATITGTKRQRSPTPRTPPSKHLK